MQEPLLYVSPIIYSHLHGTLIYTKRHSVSTQFCETANGKIHCQYTTTISWLGHLERMEEDRMPKKILTQELEGTRRRRPWKG